jgi:hypothetical protein
MQDTWRLGSDGSLIYKSYNIHLKDIMKRSANGMVTSGGIPVPLVVGEAENALKLGGVPAAEIVTVDNISVLLPVTPAPAVTAPTTVNENSVITLTIANYDNTAVYEISSNHGTLSPVSSTGTFTYTAPDITDGNDMVDTISMYSSVVGKIKSVKQEITFPILFVLITGDGVISNSDFSLNDSYSDGYRF